MVGMTHTDTHILKKGQTEAAGLDHLLHHHQAFSHKFSTIQHNIIGAGPNVAFNADVTQEASSADR